MATIDILTVLNPSKFVNNTPNWDHPEGSNTTQYSSNDYLRMLSFGDNVTNNGQWNIGVSVRRGDTLRWMDTPIDQSEGQQDMILYGLKISNPSKWRQYFTGLSAKTFHSTRFYIDSGLGTDSPQFQYVAGPNNYLEATVKAAPSDRVTLNYYLKVVKIKLVNGVITPIGTYGIDPTITILPS